MSFEAALSLQRGGRNAEAEAAYALLPQNGAAASNRAALLLARGALAEAIAGWESAIALAPTLASAHGNLASAHHRAGAPGQAWDVLRRGVALLPDSSALYARLGAVLTSGRPLSTLPPRARRAAVSLARVAAKLAPLEGSRWCNLGLALAADGRPALAAQAYQRALSVAPASADAHLGLAASQPRAAAIATLRAALALGPQLRGTTAANVYYNLGNLIHNGRLDSWQRKSARNDATTLAWRAIDLILASVSSPGVLLMMY